jgi:glycosyltransferase involved in cell wall biosynthesis
LGGLERFQLVIASAMREMGHHVQIAGEPDSGFTRAAEEAGFKTNHVRFRRYFSLFAILRLARLMRRFRADVLHYRLSKDLWTVAPAARLAGLRGKVVHTLGMNPGGRLDNPVHRWLRSTLGAFVAPTPQTARSAAAVWGMTPDDVTMIPNCVDPAPFEIEGVGSAASDLRKTWGVTSESVVLGMLGRLEPDKGIETFIRMAIELQTEPLAEDVRFVVAGPTSPGRQKWLRTMEEMAEKADLSDHVVFPGVQHDVPAFMRAIDIFVLPSHRETFGAVLVEAMMGGRPVISTHGPGPDFILGGGRFGTLFPVKDHMALAGHVRELIHDSGLRTERGAVSRGRALEAFSHKTVMPLYESLFLQLRHTKTS